MRRPSRVHSCKPPKSRACARSLPRDESSARSNRASKPKASEIHYILQHDSGLELTQGYQFGNRLFVPPALIFFRARPGSVKGGLMRPFTLFRCRNIVKRRRLPPPQRGFGGARRGGAEVAASPACGSNLRVTLTADSLISSSVWRASSITIA